MSEVGTKGFFGKALPPFLLKIQAHNDAYNAAISAQKETPVEHDLVGLEKHLILSYDLEDLFLKSRAFIEAFSSELSAFQREQMRLAHIHLEEAFRSLEENPKRANVPKPILCLDFDGVCHLYTSGWQGAAVCDDPPVEGLWEFLEEASQYFELVVYSSRSHQEGGREAMISWFLRESPWITNVTATSSVITWYKNIWRFPGQCLSLFFPLEKPRAFVTLDDRALTFQGVWPAAEDLSHFKPWNKR